MLDVAIGYCRRGWNPVPVVFKGKKPIGGAWQQRRITEQTAPQFFNGAGYNIGVILGPTSNGLTDVDLDCAETVTLAPYVLPKTEAIFGRKSKRYSHSLYITDLAARHDQAAIQLKDPRTKGVLVEIRIGGGDRGAQTVFPGSVHESDEPVTWEESGTPATVDGDELERKVRLLASCALMARYWPAKDSHGRHGAALVAGGFLSRAGHRRSVLREYVAGIAKAAGDEEWRDRRQAAEDAAIAHGAGKHTFGFTGLADTFGQDIAEKIAEWLEYRGPDDEPASEPDAPPGKTQEEPPKPDYKPLKLLRINYAHWDSEEPPDQEWGVYNRFPARQCAILSGEGAIGKSTTLLHLTAAHTLEYVDWLKAVVDHGPAVFVDCEDEEKVIWRRLAPICNHYKKRFADLIGGGLHLISLVGHDPVMAVASRSGKIEVTKRYTELLEMAGDLKPKCIAIASSANVYAGSEIDRAQVQQFAGYLTRIAQVAGGYVVLAQHPSLTGISTDTGLSGSTQWHNAVRARAYMKAPKTEAGEQPDSDLREIVFKKNQYGKIEENIILRWQDGMYLPVPGIQSLDKAAAEQKADEVFLKLLRRFNDQNQDVGAVSGTNYAPSIFAKHPDAAGIKSIQLSKAMQRLLDAKTITIEKFGPQSKRRQRLVVA